MKITKERLKQIIKEEISLFVEEEDKPTPKQKAALKFVKEHDKVARLVKKDGKWKIKVTIDVKDTKTDKWEEEVHYIEPTIKAAKRVLEY